MATESLSRVWISVIQHKVYPGQHCSSSLANQFLDLIGTAGVNRILWVNVSINCFCRDHSRRSWREHTCPCRRRLGRASRNWMLLMPRTLRCVGTRDKVQFALIIHSCITEISGEWNTRNALLHSESSERQRELVFLWVIPPPPSSFSGPPDFRPAGLRPGAVSPTRGSTTEEGGCSHSLAGKDWSAHCWDTG